MPDDRLRLMFTCCHPALSLEARVALTLRTLAGLTTAEIARAFLSSEPTMARGGPGQAEDPERGDPLPGASRAPAARTHAGRAGRAVPAVQRGLFGHGRRRPGPAEPVRGGDPAGPGAGRADAGRGGGRGPTGADAAAPRAPGRPARRPRRPGHAGGPGPGRHGTPPRSPRAFRCSTGALRRGQPAPYQVQAAIAACHATGGHRAGHGLGADRRACTSSSRGSCLPRWWS